MQTKALFSRSAISAFMILQFIPLILLPPSSFTMASQEWWLGVLLAIFSIIAGVQIVFRHSEASWPWDLIGFSQGFNIISRLMLIMPHATTANNAFNTSYVVLGVLAMLMSAAVLWYIAKPETRMGMLKG